MNERFADYYALLGVASYAGKGEIEAAYGRCVAILETANVSPEDRERARQLYDRALFVLGDAERRRAYNIDWKKEIAKSRYFAILARAGVVLGESKAATGDKERRDGIGPVRDTSILAAKAEDRAILRMGLFQRETFIAGAGFAFLLATVWAFEIAVRAGRVSPDTAPLLGEFFVAAGGSGRLWLWATLFCGSFVWWCFSRPAAAFVSRVAGWAEIAMSLVLYGICIFIPAMVGNLDPTPPTSLLLYFFLPLFLAVYIFDDEAVEMTVWQIFILLGHFACCHLLVRVLSGGMKAYDYIGDEFFTFGYVSWWILLTATYGMHERLIERKAESCRR